MNLEIKYSQAPVAERKTGSTRILVTLIATPDDGEAQFFATTRFAQTRTAIPVKLFHFPKNGVITPATGRKLETSKETLPHEAFARNGLPIQTWVNGAGINLPYPGSVSLGWVSADQIPAFKAWIDAELPDLAKRIADSVNRELAAVQETTLAPTTATTAAIVATPKVVMRVGRCIA